MKIYKNKLYILRDHPGISGFQQWDKWEYRLATGHKARLHKIDVVSDFYQNGKGLFRLEDGHLPSHQPVATEKDACKWVEDSIFGTAVLLNPEAYNLSGRTKI